MSHAKLYCGDAGAILATLPAESVQCVVTSPPYWGLRDYGAPGQLGLESTSEQYLINMVAVFGEIRRVLETDGIAWIVVGDSYASAWPAPNTRRNIIGNPMAGGKRGPQRQSKLSGALKEKDLVGIPWRLALALQADGWYLRRDIIWHKPNPMPESVDDRPSTAHEYVFMLSTKEHYYYDAEAIAEAVAESTAIDDRGNGDGHRRGRGYPGAPSNGGTRLGAGLTRNARSVWTIPTQSFRGAHFATFPEELARRCILAGSRPGDVVLDPFGGSGTVAAVATGLGRQSIYIDINPKYLELAEQRIGKLLCERVA